MSANTKLLKANTVARESINIFRVFINSPDCLLKFIIKYILKNETIYLEKVGNKVNIILQNQEYQFEAVLYLPVITCCVFDRDDVFDG